jgi:hypothetical protein
VWVFPVTALIGGAGATGGDEATAGTQPGTSAKRPPTKANAKARPATRRGLRAAPKLVAKRKLSK